MRIYADSYPALHEAMEIIAHDCGRRAGHPYYNVPSEWGPVLSTITVALASFGTDDLVTFCIGEDGERADITTTDALSMAHAFLDLFFDEDWPCGDRQ